MNKTEEGVDKGMRMRTTHKLKITHKRRAVD